MPYPLAFPFTHSVGGHAGARSLPAQVGLHHHTRRVRRAKRRHSGRGESGLRRRHTRYVSSARVLEGSHPFRADVKQHACMHSPVGGGSSHTAKRQLLLNPDLVRFMRGDNRLLMGGSRLWGTRSLLRALPPSAASPYAVLCEESPAPAPSSSPAAIALPSTCQACARRLDTSSSLVPKVRTPPPHTLNVRRSICVLAATSQ